MSGSEPTWVVGYGSLMTVAGLGGQAAGVRDVRRAAVRGRRAFGKPVQRGGCLAMDVVGDHPAVLEARALAKDEPCSPGWFGALLIAVAPDGWRGLVRREGYAAESWDALTAAAGARGPAAHLLALAEEAEDERVAYRRALRAASGPSSFTECHYLPHPVRVSGPAGPAAAVMFVSPAAGETGDPAQPAIKARYPRLRPVPASDAFPPRGYPELDPARQARYIGLCLLAAAHGIGVGDLAAGGLPEAVGLPTAIGLTEERAALGALLGAERYAASFPESLAAAWALSGLGSLATCPS